MKRVASLLLVMVILLCGCSAVNEDVAPVEEQDAFSYDVDSEDITDTKILPEPTVTEEEEKETPITEETAKEQESSAKEEPISPTVYRTESGECYHREGCYHLKSKFKTTVKRAQAMGLRACSRCHPPR